MKAIWNNQVIAESTDIVTIEGNKYFPANSLNKSFFKDSATSTHCHWKGDASYFSIHVDGKENKDAAWYYANPKDAAKGIKEFHAVCKFFCDFFCTSNSSNWMSIS